MSCNICGHKDHGQKICGVCGHVPISHDKYTKKDVTRWREYRVGVLEARDISIVLYLFMDKINEFISDAVSFKTFIKRPYIIEENGNIVFTEKVKTLNAIVEYIQRIETKCMFVRVNMDTGSVLRFIECKRVFSGFESRYKYLRSMYNRISSENLNELPWMNEKGERFRKQCLGPTDKELERIISRYPKTGTSRFHSLAVPVVDQEDTSLQRAVTAMDEENVKLLLRVAELTPDDEKIDFNFDVVFANPPRRYNALHYAIRSTRDGLLDRAAMVDIILNTKRGMNCLNAKDINIYTPLMWAVEFGYYEVIKALLEYKGIEVNDALKIAKSNAKERPNNINFQIILSYIKEYIFRKNAAEECDGAGGGYAKQLLVLRF